MISQFAFSKWDNLVSHHFLLDLVPWLPCLLLFCSILKPWLASENPGDMSSIHAQTLPFYLCVSHSVMSHVHIHSQCFFVHECWSTWVQHVQVTSHCCGQSSGPYGSITYSEGLTWSTVCPSVTAVGIRVLTSVPLWFFIHDTPIETHSPLWFCPKSWWSPKVSWWSPKYIVPNLFQVSVLTPELSWGSLIWPSKTAPNKFRISLSTSNSPSFAQF